MPKQLAFIVFMALALSLLPANDNLVLAEDNQSTALLEDDILYYYWAFCPLCDDPEDHITPFEDYPIEIEVYEIVYNPDNLERFHQVREELGIEMIIFPLFVFNEEYWIGYSETIKEEVKSAIEKSLAEESAEDRQNIIRLPLIGDINLVESPILLTTIIIAFLDGFNPCSFFVLTFLLAIIVHSASRKRITLVGVTFLLVTSLVYGLFILGALNIMLFAAQLFWIRNLVAAIVIILGVISVKDFFIFKEGISVGVPEAYKKKYYQQVRNIFYTKSVIPMITATAVMALGIALVELPCTAGFPFIWTSLIAGMDLPLGQYVLLFAVYIAIYLAVELIIFLAALIRMRTMKMTEERGRLLKLIAGSLMLVLGLILLLRPDYMESLLGILITFGATLILILIMYGIGKLLKIESS